jgi:Xaa-Pro aminopeptidase/Xaa-Pro dipeptidase
VRPQKTCASVDDACRKIIEEYSYGPHFIHSTGHGIGLDVHENPSISGKSKEKLKKDMAITVEPGIYIPKKFGVRIEDSLIVKNRAAVMHKFTKDLIVI